MLAQTINSNSVDFETLLNAFPKEFVAISKQEQGLAIALYHLLALGKPVARRQLSEFTGIDEAEIDSILETWPGVYYDDEGKVIGFWGLALNEMPHKMLIDGRELYAWCAWDTLFLPALIGGIAQVTSRCAQNGTEIQLTISQQGIESVTPETTVLSFVTPDENGIREDVINSFCHAVLFFQSPEAGNQWKKEHPDTFLLSVQDAFGLAQLFNQRKFPGLMTSAGLGKK